MHIHSLSISNFSIINAIYQSQQKKCNHWVWLAKTNLKHPNCKKLIHYKFKVMKEIHYWLRHVRKKAVKLGSESCRTASPKSRKNWSIACIGIRINDDFLTYINPQASFKRFHNWERCTSKNRPLEARDCGTKLMQRWKSLLTYGYTLATRSSELPSLHISQSFRI